MVSRYRGRIGEYMWQKDMQRLERYKDRGGTTVKKGLGGASDDFRWH